MKHLLERRGGAIYCPPSQSPLKHANKNPSLKTKPCATSFTNQTAPSTNQPVCPGGSGDAQECSSVCGCRWQWRCSDHLSLLLFTAFLIMNTFPVFPHRARNVNVTTSYTVPTLARTFRGSNLRRLTIN